jgi:hypothetical protein
MTDVEWLLEHSEVTAASPDFVWKHMTDPTNWDDPPAKFALNGPFESGSRGTTELPDQDPLHWVIREVRRGSSYTIETELEGAVLLWEWSFEPLPEHRTRLRQRIGVAGGAAARHAEAVRQGFAPTLSKGMKRIARLLAEAEAQAQGAG